MITMAIFLIMTLVSIVSGLDSSELAIFERQEALLSFRYKADVFVPFSIRIGRLAPFYADGQFITQRLSPSQINRFQVNAWHSQTRHDTIIHLRINKVHRTDGGTYTCKFGPRHRLQMKALTVNFPPGRAVCRVNPTNRSMLETVRCSATGGSPRGRIICLDSKNEEIPFTGDVGENGTHIVQEILINQTASVYCCSSNEARLVKHKCNDFVLQREYKDGMDKYTTPTQLKKGKYNSNGTLVSSLSTVKNETTTCKLNNHASVALFVLSIIILIISICICVLKKQPPVHQNVSTINPPTGKEADQFDSIQSCADNANTMEKQDDYSMEDRHKHNDVPSTTLKKRTPPCTDSED